MIRLIYKLLMLFVHENDQGVKSLRSYLIQVVLVAVLPLMVFSSGLVFYLSHQQNSELETSLSNRADAVKAVVDDKINSIFSSLKMLALTEEFDPNEFPSIHRKLSRAVKSMEGWESIALADLDGKILLHTAYPFGQALVPIHDEPFFQEAVSTGKRVFSNLRTGRNTGKKMVSIAVPIMKGKRPSLVLVGSITYDLLIQTLHSLNLDPEWNASVIDRDNIIVARSRRPEDFVGLKISEQVLEKIKESPNGVLRSINKENVPTFSVFTRSSLTNWTIVLGFPIANLSSYSDLSKIVLALGICCMLIGIFLAIRISSRISKPIAALSHSAEAFGQGLTPTPVSSSVEEVKILAQSIELASRQRIEAENTIRTLHEISSSLAGELDLKKLLQSFTDQTTILTRAEFGAYFNTASATSEFFDIVTLSGLPLERFSSFPLPRKTEIFGPTLRGEKVIRLDDVTSDPRYGKNSPFNGTPSGHPPVRSYLAVPVISRTGEVLGGLFFGHSKAGVFTQQDEKLLSSLAAQAATAIDNANLYSKTTQAVELRDTFLSVASHELKTPLTSIYLQFEILKRSTLKTTENDPKVISLFERFQSQLERLTRLINELLDVTRIASGKMDLDIAEMDLGKLVGDICTNFEGEALQKNSPISLEVKSPVIGHWDTSRVEQVVMNLISNAIKYGNKQPISIQVFKDTEWALVEIKDNGLGIAPEDQARIFQRFERAIDSNSISGLGLGLFICNEIIIRHGGEIKVESSLGQGSLFTIKLPLK